MERKDVSFSVKMRAVDLFRFKIYHVLHGSSGIFGIALTLLAVFMLVTSFNSLSPQMRVVWIIIIAWFLLVDPARFFWHSVKQVKLNPVYKKPLDYAVNENGITVSQGEANETLGWANIVKIAETKRQFIIYSSRIHAFIFPKDAVGDKCEAMRETLRFFGKENHLKMKGFGKKIADTED